MISKKINILLSSFMCLTVGIMEVPASADSGMQTASVYSAIDDGAKNYIISKDNYVEQNGLKISIDKVVGTRHKLEVGVKVESQKPFDEEKSDNISALLTYGDGRENSSGTSYGMVDDKTLKIDFEKEFDKEEIPEKGELRVDIVIPGYKINVGIDAQVDFTEAFNNVIEKDVTINVPEFNLTVKKIESSILGTKIDYSREEKSNSAAYEYDRLRAPLILKVGDKMYTTMNDGTHSARDGKSGITTITGSYDAVAATYDRVKGESSISLIPIKCSISDEETNKIYEEVYKDINNKKNQDNIVNVDGINYRKNFDFSDGTKGEIYKIERNDNSVKVYCKGATEKEGFLMAGTMDLNPQFEAGKVGYDRYNSEANKTVYKDSKDSLGYVVEFDNLEKNKNMELNFDYIIKEIDKFEIGNEVQLFK